MKRPRKKPLGLASITKATREGAALVRSFHRQHAKPVYDPKTGRVVIVKPARAPAAVTTLSFHRYHARPVYDRKTGRVAMVKPAVGWRAPAPRGVTREAIALLKGGNAAARRGRRAARQTERDIASALHDASARERSDHSARTQQARTARAENAEAQRAQQRAESITRAEHHRVQYHQAVEERRIAREARQAARGLARRGLDYTPE